MIQTALALTIVAAAAAWLVRRIVRQTLDTKQAACGACSAGPASTQSTCPACPSGGARVSAQHPAGLLQIADR